MTDAGEKKHKIALVIGSGGIKCAAAIGIWKVLAEENIRVDMIVGCSGGAVFGAAIALGATSDELATLCEKGWTPEITRKVNIKSIASILFSRWIRFDERMAIFDDTTLNNNLLEAYGKETTFADTLVPFSCIATDFHTGEPVVLSRGRLGDAVRMSSGIPILFRPMESEGRLLIDGGLSNPLPVDVAIKQGADLIIAIGFETPPHPSVAAPDKFVGQMFTILVNQLLVKKFAFYNLAYHSEIVMIVPEFNVPIKVNDAAKVPFIVAQGESETRKHLSYLRRLLAARESGVDPARLGFPAA